MDQWNRILGQLGNIHEAGQQLADARERAARAEVENQFLKERIRDLKAKADGSISESEPPPTDQPMPAVAEQEPEPEPQPEPVPPGRTLTVEMRVPEWSRRMVRRIRRR